MNHALGKKYCILRSPFFLPLCGNKLRWDTIGSVVWDWDSSTLSTRRATRDGPPCAMVLFFYRVGYISQLIVETQVICCRDSHHPANRWGEFANRHTKQGCTSKNPDHSCPPKDFLNTDSTAPLNQQAPKPFWPRAHPWGDIRLPPGRVLPDGRHRGTAPLRPCIAGEL